MSRDHLIALAVSVFVHGAIAASSYWQEPKSAVVEPREEPVTTVQVSLPPDEPEVAEDTVAEDAPAAEAASFTPPQLVDTPSFSLDAAFTQTIAPPPVAPLAVGLMKVPDGAANLAGISKSAARIFELSNLDQRPEIRFKLDPVYPQELARSRLNGEVLIGFVVDAQGNVRDPYIVSSTHAKFEAAALQAIVRWKFKPGRKDGVAVNTRVELPLSFSVGA